MSSEVVNSYNIFLDTERNLNATSDGDSINLSLNQTPITCGENQFIRMTLQSFSMYKSFTNINPNNNIFRITNDGAVAAQTDYPLYLPPQDYSSLNSLALAFANTLATQLALDTGAVLAAVPIPITGTDAIQPPQSGDTNNIIRFRIDFTAAHGLTQLLVRTLIEDGDSFEVLGTNRIREDDFTPAWDLLNSLVVDLAPASAPTPANSIIVQCLYNAQESSQQNMYLRTDVNNTNIQTESFNAENTDLAVASQLSSSRILGRMIVDNQFVNFTTGTQMEYFVSLTTKQITHMRLYITDSHGRTIPPNVPYTNNVPTFPPVKQLTLGNRSWEGVIKVDIVQYMGGQNNVLASAPVVHSVPARFGTEPMNKLNYGQDGFTNDANFARMKMK